MKDVSEIISTLLNAIASTDLIDVIARGLQDPDRGLLNPPRMGGILALMRAMRDEDDQRGIGITIALLRAIGKACVELRELLMEKGAR